MDQTDSRSHSGEGKRKRKNMLWTIEMDRCLIKTLVIQAKKGLKIDKCFKDTAYTATAEAVNIRFSLSLSNQHVVNRLKTIKRKYKIISDMLNHNGFTWNANTKMVEGNHETWAKYIAAHPDAKGFRGKSIEMYDELCIVCGNDQVTGQQMGRSVKDIGANIAAVIEDEEDSAPFPLLIEQLGMDEVGNTGAMESSSQLPGATTQVPRGSQGASSTHSPMQHKKGSPGFEVFLETMSMVASNIGRMADALERHTNALNAHELLQAVLELKDLDEPSSMSAFEYLNADPIKARAFMAYNVHMRKMFLFRHLGVGCGH